MKKRTIREFTFSEDLWPLVDSWAVDAGFTLDTVEDSYRTYRKGSWLFFAPTRLEIRQTGNRVILQVWLRAEFYMLMALMTGKPTEAGLESGGLTAWMQRKQARNAVNRLLASLGGTPIP